LLVWLELQIWLIELVELVLTVLLVLVIHVLLPLLIVSNLRCVLKRIHDSELLVFG
jgi:hypothetical protein